MLPNSVFIEEEAPELTPPCVQTTVIRWPSHNSEAEQVAEEVPVSIVYNGISHVVMMASPQDLREFAIGFSLSEQIVPDISHIYDIQVKAGCSEGYIVELEISPRSFFKLKAHRRSMVGRTGCGICGVESLEGVSLQTELLPKNTRFDMNSYQKALGNFRAVQVIGEKTGSTHAMMAFDEKGNFLGGAEDIGRHVAMDKLIGKMALNNWKKCTFFLSSRASYEMVQKAAVCGIEIIFALSAPTNRALKLAQNVNLTLCAFCKKDRANIYSGIERLYGF